MDIIERSYITLKPLAEMCVSQPTNLLSERKCKTMEQRVKKPLNLQSQTFKVKPSRHFTESVQKVKECLTEYRYDVSHQKICSLQDSMNLEKTFQDALSEYEVEVVCVTRHEGGTLDYLKRRKSSRDANVVACIHLEVENEDGTLRLPKQNLRLLGEKYPCETIINIQEANCAMEQHVAAIFSEFQPLAETNRRREMIINWLKEYEEALNEIKNKIKQVVDNLTDDTPNSTSTQENIDFSKECQNGKVMTFKVRLQQQFPDEAMCEKILQISSDHSLESLQELEEKVKIVQDQLQMSYCSGSTTETIPARHPCHLTSFCYGVMDSKNDQLVFGFRAESFDRTHVTISPSLKASIDVKTIREATQESQTVDEYIGNSLDLSLEDRKRLFNVIDKYSEELMEKHSNLNWMDVSPVVSHQTRLEETPCIVIYCSCKGIRPLDEPLFPTELDGLKVDVREGFCSLFSVTDSKEYNDPLRTGISIGGKDMEGCGSIGPFVHEAEGKTSVGFLTCQHVFSSPEIGTSVVQPSLDHYKSNTDPEKTICGTIRSMCMETVEYNGKQIGVDVAYVAIDNRIPKEFEFPDIPESMITEHLQKNPQMGQPIIHLDNNHIGLTIYKLGQATGLTKGTLGTVHTIVNFGNETFKNVYLVSSTDKAAAAEPGDSGCSVFIANKNTLSVIGLLLGGTKNCKTFFVIPIGAALQALEPKLEIHQFSSVNHPHGGACASPSDAGTSTSETVHHLQLSKSLSTFSSKK